MSHHRSKVRTRSCAAVVMGGVAEHSREAGRWRGHHRRRQLLQHSREEGIRQGGCKIFCSLADDVLTHNLPNTAPAGRLLHPRELGGAPRGGGAAGGRVLAGGGGHHPDLHLLQQGRRHAGGLRAHGRWQEEGVGCDCAVQCLEINTASCSIARAAADKWGTIVAGGIVQTASYRWIDV